MCFLFQNVCQICSLFKIFFVLLLKRKDSLYILIQVFCQIVVTYYYIFLFCVLPFCFLNVFKKTFWFWCNPLYRIFFCYISGFFVICLRNLPNLMSQRFLLVCFKSLIVLAITFRSIDSKTTHRFNDSLGEFIGLRI